MNRQEVVLAIAKINRFIKQLNYWCELKADINLDVFGEELFKIGNWTKEVHNYLREYPSTSLVGIVEDIGSVASLKEYIVSKGDEIPKQLKNTLTTYIGNMESLQKDLGLLKKKGKGRYANLPTPLANGKAADLLQRAVKVGILEKDFQPKDGVGCQKLKVLAFAVAQLMNFNSRHTYVFFDRLWQRGGYHISSVVISTLSTNSYQDVLDIFPEVDFSRLLTKEYTGYVFNSPFDEKRKLKLYKELRYQGYIEQCTTKDQFLGIFDASLFKKPVNWIRTQRLLAYFVKLAFEPTNSRLLWIKTMSCFLINGKEPVKACFITGYSQLSRSSNFESYEPSLKAIADEYSQDYITENNSAKVAGLNKIKNINLKV